MGLRLFHEKILKNETHLEKHPRFNGIKIMLRPGGLRTTGTAKLDPA